MNIAALIASFLTGTYTVTRRAAATYVLGNPVAGGTSTFTVQASVQPANGRDLLRLPEGRRSTESRVLYTTTQLLVGAQGAANESDLVAIDGKTWEVQLVETWSPFPLTNPGYYRCIVQVAG